MTRAVQGPDRAVIAGDGPGRGYWLQPCPHSSALTRLQCMHAASSIHTEQLKPCHVDGPGYAVRNRGSSFCTAEALHDLYLVVPSCLTAVNSKLHIQG